MRTIKIVFMEILTVKYKKSKSSFYLPDKQKFLSNDFKFHAENAINLDFQMRTIRTSFVVDTSGHFLLRTIPDKI